MQMNRLCPECMSEVTQIGYDEFLCDNCSLFMCESDVIFRPTPLALDGGDSAASEQFPTPEVLSTLQGESTPALRK